MQVSPQQTVTGVTGSQPAEACNSDRMSLFGLDFQLAYRIAAATVDKTGHRSEAQGMAAKIRAMSRVAADLGHSGLMITLSSALNADQAAGISSAEGRKGLRDLWRWIRMDLAHARVRTYGCVAFNLAVANAANPTLFVLAMHAREDDRIVRATIRAHADVAPTTAPYSRAQFSPFHPDGGLAVEFFAELAAREVADDQYTLAALADRAPADRAIRRAALMNRIAASDRCWSAIDDKHARRASAGQAEDVLTALDAAARETDFVGKSVLLKPALKAEGIAAAEAPEVAVNVAGIVAHAYQESRRTLDEGREGFWISDIDAFNQFCIEFGYGELRVQGGSNEVGTDAFVKSFHEQFPEMRKRDPFETLQYLYKYAVVGGFNGVSAPADWLKSTGKYIADATAAKSAAIPSI
ncbi:hypothetical protein [Burkholderia glumae]|uniref:hypothetical protein n=1 Tax=Burkholderia glumae TaxID=337 RepID=UPI002150E63C|nr:hypothetical protein [Burkholderia glumae]